MKNWIHVLVLFLCGKVMAQDCTRIEVKFNDYYKIKLDGKTLFDKITYVKSFESDRKKYYILTQSGSDYKAIIDCDGQVLVPFESHVDDVLLEDTIWNFFVFLLTEDEIRILDKNIKPIEGAVFSRNEVKIKQPFYSKYKSIAFEINYKGDNYYVDHQLKQLPFPVFKQFNGNFLKNDTTSLFLVTAQNQSNETVYGIFNAFSGEFLVPLQKEEINVCYEGFGCAVKNANGKYAFVNCNTGAISPPIFDALYPSKEATRLFYYYVPYYKIAEVKRNGKVALLDVEKATPIPLPDFDKASYTNEVALILEKNNKWALYSPKGESILSFEEGYEEINLAFQNDGLFPVKKNGKWGCFDALAKRLIVDCIYDSMESPRDRMAKVVLKGQTQTIKL